MSTLPDLLRGDGPCADCGTLDNIVWFTESAFWNTVCPQEGIVCIPCFIKRTETAGYAPTGWKLTPEFHWETRAEYEARRGVERPCGSCGGTGVVHGSGQNGNWTDLTCGCQLPPPRADGLCCDDHGSGCVNDGGLICCWSCGEDDHPRHLDGSTCVLATAQALGLTEGTEHRD